VIAEVIHVIAEVIHVWRSDVDDVTEVVNV